MRVLIHCPQFVFFIGLKRGLSAKQRLYTSVSLVVSEYLPLSMQSLLNFMNFMSSSLSIIVVLSLCPL